MIQKQDQIALLNSINNMAKLHHLNGIQSVKFYVHFNLVLCLLCQWVITIKVKLDHSNHLIAQLKSSVSIMELLKWRLQAWDRLNSIISTHGKKRTMIELISLRVQEVSLRCIGPKMVLLWVFQQMVVTSSDFWQLFLNFILLTKAMQHFFLLWLKFQLLTVPETIWSLERLNLILSLIILILDRIILQLESMIQFGIIDGDQLELMMLHHNQLFNWLVRETTWLSSEKLQWMTNGLLPLQMVKYSSIKSKMR